MVHRRVEYNVDTAEAVLKGVVEQLVADRTAITALYGAIQTVANVVNKHDEGMTELDSRLAEQTRMRLDDHRLHVGAMTHVRTGVEATAADLEASQKKLGEYVDTAAKATYAELEKKMEEIKRRVEEAIPQLVETKFASIQGALDKIRATEEEMKMYLAELDRARPEEGKLVFNAFS